jgi:hypothetical protein
VQRALIAAAFAVFSAFILQAKAAEVPKRKPGLWEITTVAAGTGMTTVTACVGPDDRIATPEESGDCSEPTARAVGSEIFVDVVCKRKFGKQIMSTAFSGDFGSRYHAIMKITFDPPEGVPNMGVIIDGKYLGPDCGAAASQKPVQ